MLRIHFMERSRNMHEDFKSRRANGKSMKLLRSVYSVRLRFFDTSRSV